MSKHLQAKQFNEIKKTFQAAKQNGFVTAVNARVVHEWLGVRRDFSTWIKDRIERYKFKEHVDYCVVSNLSSPDLGSSKSRPQLKKEYHCTPDMVKQLAMVENSSKGQLVRLYFLDCESKSIELQQQIDDRRSLRVEFRPMTDAVKDMKLLEGKEAKPYHYSNESDMINRIVLGMTAAKFRSHHDINKKEGVRDYMTEMQMKSVIELQRMNTGLISMGMDFGTRKENLITIFNNRFASKLFIEINELES